MSVRLLVLGFLVAFAGLFGPTKPAVASTSSVGKSESKRPNFVWIVSEDNSIHYLRLFFDGGVSTPAIERLASEGLTYQHAFSNAPVCSVARTTLATMCYAPRIGTQFHRRYVAPPMPEGLRLVSEWLMEAGYYTTNRSKTDYNVAVKPAEVWSESSKQATWRNRPNPSQPFFHMESHAESHESSLHFKERLLQSLQGSLSPDEVTLAPYHPDTPLFRLTHAYYLDKQKEIDRRVEETVNRLARDGVLEDTFIFYFGDHGGVLPRSKGYVYDTGLHVPLVIRVPHNFRHLIGDFKVGTTVNGFVSFVDFGATLLHLAGIESPTGIDGKPFLGQGILADEVNSRDEAFGYADRMDERSEFVRSLRKGRYHYIRSFQPWLPDGLNNNYRFKMLAYAEWRSLWLAGELDTQRAAFFHAKPTEQLFDCDTDPHQVRNLAEDPRFASILTMMRRQLGMRMQQMPDLSYFPESYLIANAMENPTEYGIKSKARIIEMATLADLVFQPFETCETTLRKAIANTEPMIRMWAVMVCNTFGERSRPMSDAVLPLLEDENRLVRLRAAEYLGRMGIISPQTYLSELVNKTNDPVFATEVFNSIVWFQDHFSGKYPVESGQIHPRTSGLGIEARLDYLFSLP